MAQATATKAHENYQQFCAACHGSNYDGRGPMARAVVPAPTNLLKAVNRHKPMELMHDIMHGEEIMPVWNEILTHDDVGEIIKIIRKQAKI